MSDEKTQLDRIEENLDEVAADVYELVKFFEIVKTALASHPMLKGLMANV